MQPDRRHLEEIPRDECLRLIATVPVGRIIYTRQALPAVELVNFAMHDGDIVFRTSSSGKLAAAIRGAIVAFEVDQLDRAARTGWSVTTIGPSCEVSDPDDDERLRGIGLTSWAPGGREHFVRISPGIVNGWMLRSGS